MRKIFLICIVAVFLLSGCDEPVGTPVGCTGKGIEILDYNVNPLNLYPGDIATVVFWIQNRGSVDANNVQVDFFDLQGFEILRMDCEGKDCNNIGQLKSSSNCNGERKKVEVQLKAPENTGQKTISFSVDYDYSGVSKTLFNIWDTNVESQFGKRQNIASGGPINVEIKPDFFLRRVTGDKQETITEWIQEDQRFMMQIDVKESLRPDYKTSGGTIKKENFKVSFVGVKPDPNFSERCNLTASGGYYIPKNDIDLSKRESIKCNMIADQINQDYMSGKIEVSYSYRYKLIKQQQFQVQ